jgi:four helix bundle protein
MVYRITKKFPGEEKFSLVSQMRRAAISIPANIAEGFKRRGLQDKIRFYNTAVGSLEELKYFFILAKDLEYTRSNGELVDQANTVGRLLYGLIRSTEQRSK